MIHVDRRQEDNSFPFEGVRHARDRDNSLGLAVQTKCGHNLLLERFMRHHLTADFGEAREAPLDVKETILIESADIAGLKPPILQHFRGSARIMQVALEYVGASQPKHPAIV